MRLTAQAVREIGRRYEDGGLAQALDERPRPGAAAMLDEGQKQRIIALVCSESPEGRARWSVWLVAEAAVKRGLVPQVGRETIGLRWCGRMKEIDYSYLRLTYLTPLSTLPLAQAR